MKKLYITILGLLSVLSLVSCQVEESLFSGEEIIEETTITIVGHHADGDTKSVLGEGGSVLWMPHDSISVFYGNEWTNGWNLKCISDNTSPAGTVSFVGTIPAKEFMPEQYDNYYYAFYPYKSNNYFSGGQVEYDFPAVQFAKKDSFGAKCFPSYARSTNLEMFFYNVCGGIKLTVTKEGVKTISLRGNSGESISGRGSVHFENDRPRGEIWYDSDPEDKTITLIAPEGGFEVGAAYYLVIPPTIFAEGFTMTFLTDTEKAVRVVNKRVEIQRNVFSKLTDADKSVEYEALPSWQEMLVGPGGKKYWFWDFTGDRNGIVCGAGHSNVEGYGYLLDGGVIPGDHWGSDAEDETFHYMVIDDKFNCVTYSETGEEIRRGKYSVDAYSSSYRKDGWGLGKFVTDGDAIPRPWGFYGSSKPLDYEILYLSDDQLILGRICDMTDWDGTPYYDWWRFRSVDEETFKKGLPTSISLDKTRVEVYQGYWFDLTASITPEDCSFWGIKWLCEGNLGRNDQPGWFYAYEEDQVGPAMVAVETAGGLRAECEVIIKYRKRVESFSIDPTEMELRPGDTARINAIFAPEDASIKDVRWESFNHDIATIDSTGLVTAISPGFVQLRATSLDSGHEAWCNVNVLTIPVTGVTLDKETAEMEIGDRMTLVATVLPENASNKTVTWTADKNNVVTVDSNGVVKAIGSGRVTVTATTNDGHFVASCRILVKSDGMEPGIGDWGDGDHDSGTAE